MVLQREQTLNILKLHAVWKEINDTKECTLPFFGASIFSSFWKKYDMCLTLQDAGEKELLKSLNTIAINDIIVIVIYKLGFLN